MVKPRKTIRGTVNLVDIVIATTTINDTKLATLSAPIIVDPAKDKYVAKDRTGRLGRYIESQTYKDRRWRSGGAEYADYGSASIEVL